jgi:hypothetical protein
MEVFELSPAPASLPGVVYIQCVHSPQAMSHSEHTFCTGTYGLTRLTPPWLLHPNEILDGALSGPYRTLFATSWTVVNNPILLDLYRRHGRDLRLLGVIAFRTEWTTQTEKDLMAEQAAKLAQMLGAQGAIVTWDAGGNEYIEVVHTVRACERLGIKTVFLTSEDSPEGGAPSLLKPVPEADAIVTTGFFNASLLDLGLMPPVERVIGYGTRGAGSAEDATILMQGDVDAAGSIPAPWRYDDHYGFNRLSSGRVDVPARPTTRPTWTRRIPGTCVRPGGHDARHGGTPASPRPRAAAVRHTRRVDTGSEVGALESPCGHE